MDVSKPIRAINQALTATAAVLLLSLGGWGGYTWGRARLAEAVYRNRLLALHAQYDDLRSAYNDVVRRTAVAELSVSGKTVSLVYHVGGRDVETVVLPYSADDEIYVDFVVIDGRLLIRRVFNEQTPPNNGILLDDALLHVDWNDPTAKSGKAVYRRLGEGRWCLSVTGNGALGLERLDPDAPRTRLVAAPVLTTDAELLAELDAATAAIGIREVATALLSRP